MLCKQSVPVAIPVNTMIGISAVASWPVRWRAFSSVR